MSRYLSIARIRTHATSSAASGALGSIAPAPIAPPPRRKRRRRARPRRREPVAINETFSGHPIFRRRRAPGGAERGVGEQLRQREDTEAVERRDRGGKLPGMARARIVSGSSIRPVSWRAESAAKVVVLAGRHVFVETADSASKSGRKIAAEGLTRQVRSESTKRSPERLHGAGRY